MSIPLAARFLLSLLVGGAVAHSIASDFPQTDVPHSQDSPIVSRFAGSTIVAYQQVNYDEVALPLGPFRNNQFAKTLATTGKVTRIVYASPAGKTPAEILANFRNSLQASGFKLLYSCMADRSETGCGGMSFSQQFAQQIFDNDSAHANTIVEVLYSAEDDVRYLLAELQRDG